MKNKKMPMKKIPRMMHSENEMGGMMKKMPVPMMPMHNEMTKKSKKKKRSK